MQVTELRATEFGFCKSITLSLFKHLQRQRRTRTLRISRKFATGQPTMSLENEDAKLAAAGLGGSDSDMDEERVVQKKKSLIGPSWAKELVDRPSTEVVLNASDLVLGKTALTPDHMFTAFLRHSLVLDLVSVFEKEERTVYTLYHLGTDVCGHPEIVHGGLTSAMIDETFGILVYMLKRHGHVDPGPAFTAHLEVDFRKPIPAGIEVMCKCWLDSVEGRKIWIRSEVRDSPDGHLFAEGKALFVNSKEKTASEHMARKVPQGDGLQPADSEPIIATWQGKDAAS